mgnify:FL=1
MDKITVKHYIEYTKDGITDKFHEGDKVICRTADKEYTGTIACVGEFKENEEAEPVTVICLDTSKSVWSHSSEIIKFDDIEFMCKDFLADTDINSDILDEEIRKNTYIHMFTGMGCDKSKVENVWNSLNKLMKQFDNYVKSNKKRR